MEVLRMEKSNTRLSLKLFVAATFVLMVTVNALAALLPINGVTPGEVSDSYPNLFAPAGYTFSIWSLIYLLLAAHTLYQIGLFRGREHSASADLLRKTGIVFSISSLVNTAWIFAWHYKLIPLSMALMAMLLICLINIAIIIDAQHLSAREMLFIRLPFFVYFGWITVATIANATVLLVSLGWNGFGFSQQMWTIIILAVGALIGTATLLRFKCASYGLVLIWAYTGILMKHFSASGFAKQYPGVIITAGICLAVFATAVIFTLLKKPRGK